MNEGIYVSRNEARVLTGKLFWSQSLYYCRQSTEVSSMMLFVFPPIDPATAGSIWYSREKEGNQILLWMMSVAVIRKARSGHRAFFVHRDLICVHVYDVFQESRCRLTQIIKAGLPSSDNLKFLAMQARCKIAKQQSITTTTSQKYHCFVPSFVGGWCYSTLVSCLSGLLEKEVGLSSTIATHSLIITYSAKREPKKRRENHEI